MLRGLRLRYAFAALWIFLPRLALAVCQIQTVASISPTDPNGGAANVQISFTAAPSNGAAIAAEGAAERLTDVLIFDNGTSPNCFTAGNVITLIYTAPLTAVPSTLTSPANYDIFDSSAALGVNI